MWTKLIEIVETRWNEGLTPKHGLAKAINTFMDRYTTAISLFSFSRITGVSRILPILPLPSTV